MEISKYCGGVHACSKFAGGVVPEGGVSSRFFTDDEVDVLLDRTPIHTLILTGHQYPGHPWRETTPVLQAALEQDPRIRVDVSERLEILADQHHDLSTSLGQLLGDIFAGRKRLKVYFQFKMYNDPAMNPQLYQGAKPDSK